MSLAERIRAVFGGRGRGDEPEVVRADVGYTLVQLDPELGVHEAQRTRRRTWYLDVSSAPGRAEAVGPALRRIFERHAEGFRRAEPADTGYLSLVDFRDAPVRFASEGPYPWEGAPDIVWEAASCYAVVDDRRVVPLRPVAFTTHLLVRRLADGTLPPVEFRALALPRFGSDPDLVAKIVAHPRSFVDLGLQMAEAAAGWA